MLVSYPSLFRHLNTVSALNLEEMGVCVKEHITLNESQKEFFSYVLNNPYAIFESPQTFLVRGDQIHTHLSRMYRLARTE